MVPNAADSLVPNAAPSSGGSGTPGGTNGQVQYNNAGAFGGYTTSGDATVNTATGALTLASTIAAAGPVGDASHVAAVTYDAKGRLTTVSSVAIAIASGAVSGLVASATTDTTNASNISSGVLAQARGGEAVSPMYVNTAGVYYPPANTHLGSVSTGAGVAGSIYLMPIWIGMPSTWQGIAFKVGTGGAGASAFSVGLYSSLATSGFTNRPGALLANSNGSTSTSTGNITLSFTSNAGITTPGWYWMAFQYGDVTQRLFNAAVNGTTIGPCFEGYMGSATLANTQGTGGLIGVSTTGVVGTWPNFTSGTTFSEITGIPGSTLLPWMALQIASLP